MPNPSLTDPYRTFGRGHVDARRPDPRIARHVLAALGTATAVVNVGAGAAAYLEDGVRASVSGVAALARESLDVGYRLVIVS